MIAIGTHHSHYASAVIAQFPDCLVSFEMPRGATFADLAERLANFEQRMDEMPIAIAVRPAEVRPAQSRSAAGSGYRYSSVRDAPPGSRTTSPGAASLTRLRAVVASRSSISHVPSSSGVE